MKQFKRIDNLIGWLTFIIAATVYCSTIEPTASFWDCPEFIATGTKLEIGHPPGAPFFMLTANLFSHFASDPTQIAKMINIMSALLSAVTIMFLFWTITHFARKLVVEDENAISLSKLIAIEASGLVGALIYTFSDTFWYSAVEGEVYAYSSAFTAVVLWLILKWEDHADEPHSDRWLVLIMYLMGLSIGVHLLNLLCIPAIVLVYVYRKFPHIELKGSIIALVISGIIVAAVLYGVVPGIITVGGWFELFFVNTLGMPFNTGVVVYILCLISAQIWAILETYTGNNQLRSNIAFTLAFALLGVPFYGYGWKAVVIGIIVLAITYYLLNFRKAANGKQQQPLVSMRIKNTLMLCMFMLVLGYSSYAVTVIRSTANPPMDQNSPEDIFTLGKYLSRQQYGENPLFYGPAYSSQVQLERDGNYCKPVVKEGAPVWQRKEKASPDEKDSYTIVDYKKEYQYAQNMFFPRMYSPMHGRMYEQWMGGIDGYQVPYDRCGEDIMVKIPTQMENLGFFVSYQVNFMYWRYFLWNFAGRQNDLPSTGELEHGNWITGFSWFDNMRLGDQSKLPDELKNNKGHNVFYCLPLLLGIIGLFWQAYRGKRGIRQFWVVFFLFFMTGLAIVLYINQTPAQPRERDYSYAGSFYAYSIWCGLGVLALIDWAKKFLKKDSPVIAAVIGVVALAVPIQMASQTWDDHDRSNRYTCRDFGSNYLMTLQDKGNPIIFTNGDNDTFPLWYIQDVEGVRTDTRVCNLSYLQTDWYIDQMRRPAYNSPALPITWPRLDYCADTNDVIQVMPELKEEIKKFYKENPKAAKEQFGDNPFELKNILKYWVRSNNPQTKVIPTDTLYLTIDKEAVRKSGMMMAADSIPDHMVISLAGKTALYKDNLMMLEIIANANWTRPVYVALTVGEDNYMNLGDNFVMEGLARRITPFTTNAEGARDFDTEKTYNNVMYRYRYGGLEKPGLYIDDTVMRMINTHKIVFVQLAMELLREGKEDKAAKVLAKADKVLPSYNIPINYDNGGLEFARAYGMLNNSKMMQKYFNATMNTCNQYVTWYLSLDGSKFTMSMADCWRELQRMAKGVEDVSMFDSKLASKWEKIVNTQLNLYRAKGGILYGQQ